MAVESGDLPARLRADHERVTKEVQEIRAIIGSEISAERVQQWRLDLLQALGDLANDLLKHFELDEEAGFMSEVLRRAPQKAAIVERLQREHAEIARRLNEVVMDVEAVRDRNDWRVVEIPRRTTAVLALLDAHEAAEASLIEETYVQDEGGSD